jgi:hypothetical protein
MPIPTLSRKSVEQVLEALAGQLDEITSGPNRSTKYDLLWKVADIRPRSVVSMAVELQYGYSFPELEFSGGKDPGHASFVLEQLGFTILVK